MVLQRFEEKTALITGGGGMGRAVALRLLSEGGRVLVTDHIQDTLARLKQEFDELGYADRTRFLLSDVRIYRDCCAAVQKGVEWFGKIDILVTTAGILRHHPIDLLTEKDWKDVVDVNPVSYTHLNHCGERRQPGIAGTGRTVPPDVGQLSELRTVEGFKGGIRYGKTAAKKIRPVRTGGKGFD